MADQGWLYLLMNPSMEGLIKIGKTNRDPDNRAQELSGATGVLTPFILVYKAFVDNCSEAESFVHTLLESKNYRVTKNREFFSAPVNVGIDAIMEAKRHFDSRGDNVDDVAPTQTFSDNSHLWQDIIGLADDYYYGLGDTIQNIHEALKLYLQAYKLGSPMSCLIIGDIY